MKRIFVAIKISETAKREVSNYVENLRDEFKHLRIGWEKEEKLHLTMKFFGDTAEDKIEKIKMAVKETAINFSSVRLKLNGTGVFPNRKKARVLWLGIDDENKELKKVYESLENNFENCGFAKEKRSFNPHLTIARLREPLNSKKIITNHLQNEFEPVEFEALEIVIIESKLQPTGSFYSVLAEYRLGE